MTECLDSCADAAYVCPQVTMQWSLSEPDTYLEEVSQQTIEPANSPSNLVYQRDESIELQDAHSTFQLQAAEKSTLVFSYRSTEDAPDANYLIASLP